MLRSAGARALEIASEMKGRLDSHDARDQEIHKAILDRLEKMDQSWNETRSELIGYLTKMSARQWQAMIGLVTILLGIAAVLLKDKLGLH